MDLLQNKVIAFDAGMRTFCTEYDLDGIIIELGKSDISRIKFETWLMNSTKKKKKNSKMGLRKSQYYTPTQI
jgi:hypothetical protein